MNALPIRVLRLLLLVTALLFTTSPASAACSTGACISAGPRLASVNSTRSTLLNALLGNLAGTSLNLTVADWNTLAQGDLNLASTLSALQASLGVSSPSAALAANASLAQVVSAMATAAQGENKLALAGALGNLQSQLALTGGSIRLGQLLATDGLTGTTRLNALDLASATVQLYNARNVAGTPTPVTISGSSVGLGSVVNSIQLAAQVVEPPVYVCGGIGSSFHTGAIRVKLGLDLVTLAPNASALNLIPLVSGASISLAHLDLYAEVARAEGSITALDAIANTLGVQATPGVADLYLGSISDAVFFNRSHVLAASDVGYATIGTLSVNATTVDIQARSSARGEAPFASTLSFSGPYPQTRTASSSAAFLANFVDTLAANLQLSLSPSLGALDAALLPTVKTIVSGSLTPVLNTLLTSLVDPLLELLGIRLGEVDVTAGAPYQVCSISGTVYNDANHSARQELAESGCALTLYAKLVAASTPAGPASQVVAVDAAGGGFSFAGVVAGTYSIVIDTNATPSDVTPTAPAGWIATEASTLSRSVTLSDADIANQSFGLYNGSKLGGRVFKDNGAGGGTANNGLRDGAEPALAGVALKLTDASGNVSLDSTVSGDSGAYTLWIPAAAGAATLNVIETNAPGFVSVNGSAGNSGGSYSRVADSMSFAHVIGSVYTGVDFADVPDNTLTPDGQQSVQPGAVAFYAHRFVAGSAGQLLLTAAAPVAAGWSSSVFLDANCNGSVDSGEAAVSAALSVVADQTLCVVVKVFAPQTAAIDAQYPVTLSAAFSYANSSLASSQARTDLSVVAHAADAALRLVKSVDKAQAKSGELITYTIVFVNQGSTALSGLKVFDATPAYTVFGSAACVALPASLGACTLSAQPAGGASGRIEWTFTGELAAGAGGTLSFTVTLQ